jgi:hypothetical protein
MRNVGKVLVGLVAALMISGMIGYIGRGDISQLVVTIYAIGLLGISLLSTVPVALWGMTKRITPSPMTKGFCAFALGAICILVLGLFVGDFWQKHDVRVAKEYPAQVAPLLEKYRREHGAYPQNLEQLPTKPPLPRVESFSYEANGKSYSFSFHSPGDLFGFSRWDYDSARKNWEFISD